MQQIIEVAQDVKTAVAVSIGTTGMGYGTWIDLIPDNIGKLGSAVGIALAIVLIGVHLHAAWIRHRNRDN